MLDGVEISTSGGHYIAIDMPAAPYPLGGEARDVVEDVRRLGGFGIVAHPDSPKAQLEWGDWTAPFDGIELLNLDTSWRVIAAQPGWAPKRRLLAGMLAYPFRAPEVMATAIQPSTIVERWASLARDRRIALLAGADAHAKLAPRSADPGDSTFALPFPGYESSFRVMSVHVRLERALSGDATPDAAAVLQGIRSGHVYTAVDGLATPPSFEFTATNALGTAQAGDVLGAGGAVQLHVRSNAPDGFVTVVHEGTRTISAARDAQDLTGRGPDGPGVYWRKIVSRSGMPPVVWVRSNPIYVRAAEGPVPPQPPPPTGASRAIFDGHTTDAWNVEHDAQSLAAFDVASVADAAGAPAPLRARRRCPRAGSSPRCGPAAVRRGAARRRALHVRAERPMRVSLQMRDTDRRSLAAVCLRRHVSPGTNDPVRRTSCRSARRTRRCQPRDAIRNIMFVVDMTNTKPGTRGGSGCSADGGARYVRTVRSM